MSKPIVAFRKFPKAPITLRYNIKNLSNAVILNTLCFQGVRYLKFSLLLVLLILHNFYFTELGRLYRHESSSGCLYDVGW
jgi:hypothetical protein